MKVSIIVPHFNGLSILRTCLASLVSHDRTPDQIIVVDNGSTDGSMDLVPGEFPDVEFVCLGRNTGFTGANNAGIEAATGDFIVLLNNDCIVEKNWLENLLARMEDQSVASVTSSMRNINNIQVMDSAGGEIDWMGFSRDIGKGEPASLHREPGDVPFPCGGAVMIRRSALPHPSRLFWKALFIYQEDLDLGFELVRTGWRVVYEPSAVVRHMHSATTGRGSFMKEYHCIRNRFLVLRKHFDVQTFNTLKPVLRRWQTLWLASSVAKRRFILARAILKGTADGMKMPVEFFEASLPLSEVFIRHAIHPARSGEVKRNLYEKAERMIRQGIRG